ncbi:MAG: ABC transporter permease [Dehalococcoidia bacterium]|nr:ABC transporter permease [Dehalococcoidia bacterium]MCA9852413.1 ABC transporter permease [Dehalococcoidia bacterium]
MREYAIRRLAGAAVVVALVSIIVFILMHLLPGDALLTKLGETGRIPEDQMDELRAKMGIDDPLYVQYFRWVGDIFDGSMGESLIYDGREVSGRIMDAAPVTLELGLLAMAAAMVIGVPLGVIAAIRQDGPIDYLCQAIALTGLSVPSFLIGLLVIIYGTLHFGYRPPREYIGLTEDPIGNLKQMAIPVLILGYGLAASIMRMTRSTVLETLRQDYTRTARAKGLAARVVVWRHVLRNALIPVVTMAGNQAAFILSGALIIEILFIMPGLGQLTYTAIIQRDYTQVQGNALVVAAIVVLVNLVVDLSYGLIDPRIRYG